MEIVTLLKVIALIIMMESSGNPSAIGDNGEAVGILQIHQIMVRDVNRISGSHYVAADRLDPHKSVEMAVIYLRHYGSTSRLGRRATVQDLLLMWNGGPNFYRHPTAPAAQAYMRQAEIKATPLGINTLAKVDMEIVAADIQQLFNSQPTF